MNKKKIALIVFGSTFFGLVSGAMIFTSNVQANFLKDFFNNLVPGASYEKSAPLNSGYDRAGAVSKYEPSRDSYEEQIISAVEKTMPSVVSIIISKDLPVVEQCSYDPFGDLPDDFKDFFGGNFFNFSKPCNKGTSGTRHEDIGGGTGFVISSDGMILTNKHVVSDAEADYTVITNDGKKFKAKVLARDPAQDLAIVKIAASGLTALPLGDSDGLRLGQTVIAIGNALSQFRNTVSVGVVSGLARNITAGGGSSVESISGVIQTDAAINPGNSGGPLLNLRGEVVGINTAIVSGAQNIGFAFPINQAKRDIQSVKTSGEIKVPYLGVRYRVITPDLKEKEKLSVDYGALLRGNDDGPAVISDSPASKAGLLAEDIILEVNGTKVDTDHSLGQLVQKYTIGEMVTLKVLRGGKEIEARVVLGERK